MKHWLFFVLCLAVPLKLHASANIIEAILTKDDARIIEIAKNNPKITPEMFVDSITKYPRLFNLITDTRKDFLSDITKFLKKNRISPMTTGYFQLKEITDAYIRTSFVLELQLIIAESKSAHLLGQENLENMNRGIEQLVTKIIDTANLHQQQLNFSRNLGLKLEADFINTVLAKRVILTRSEQWINQSLGLDKNYIHRRDLWPLVENILRDRRSLVLTKFRNLPLSAGTCAQLFTI